MKIQASILRLPGEILKTKITGMSLKLCQMKMTRKIIMKNLRVLQEPIVDRDRRKITLQPNKQKY